MAQKFLLDLADVLSAARVNVIEVHGWEFRSRASGGYDDSIDNIHVMWHHTASGPASDGQSDVNYICFNSTTRPICNIYIDRKGSAWVCAGGCTNTNGIGTDTWGGGVPKDSMNRYAIGIEIANNGSGEVYTPAQQATIRKVRYALTKAYDIEPSHHRAHFEWAPDRKIDPAGMPAPWANVKDRYLRWDMNQFRAELSSELAADNTPTPTPIDPSGYKRIVMTNGFEFASAPRWDTRGFGAPIPAGQYDVKLGGSNGKLGAKVNLTIVQATFAGYATTWMGTTPAPNTSSINYVSNGAIANQVDVPIAPDGTFKIYISTPAHIIIDLVGYWV